MRKPFLKWVAFTWKNSIARCTINSFIFLQRWFHVSTMSSKLSTKSTSSNLKTIQEKRAIRKWKKRNSWSELSIWQMIRSSLWKNWTQPQLTNCFAFKELPSELLRYFRKWRAHSSGAPILLANRKCKLRSIMLRSKNQRNAADVTQKIHLKSSTIFADSQINSLSNSNNFLKRCLKDRLQAQSLSLLMTVMLMRSAQEIEFRLLESIELSLIELKNRKIS